MGFEVRRGETDVVGPDADRGQLSFGMPRRPEIPVRAECVGNENSHRRGHSRSICAVRGIVNEGRSVVKESESVDALGCRLSGPQMSPSPPSTSAVNSEVTRDFETMVKEVRPRPRQALVACYAMDLCCTVRLFVGSRPGCLAVPKKSAGGWNLSGCS